MTSASPNPDALSYHQAAALIAAHAAQLSGAAAAAERVPLGQAQGRVLAQPIHADSDQPAFARSARDGYACRAREISAHMPLALAGTIRAGQAPGGPLPPNAVWEIMTGAAVPAGADSVVMLEHVEITDGPSGATVRLLPPHTAAEGGNIVPQGAQARKGDEVLAVGATMDAAQIALAASCGYAAVGVFPRPRVAILATGDEIVPIESTPALGQIRDSNAAMLAALVVAAGGTPWVFPPVADTAEALDAALARSADADLLVITGGVSAGKFDLVEPALARAGARFHFTGVRIQPGKPAVFAKRLIPGTSPDLKGRSMQCCFGLPGNPVSTAVTFALFAAPVLAALAGKSEPVPRFALAELAAPVKTKPGLTRFLPATCDFSIQRPRVALVPWHGSGDIAAMALANCYLVVPEDATQLDPGVTVRILLP